jgi:hypothetical protein
MGIQDYCSSSTEVVIEVDKRENLASLSAFMGEVFQKRKKITPQAAG